MEAECHVYKISSFPFFCNCHKRGQAGETRDFSGRKICCAYVTHVPLGAVRKGLIASGMSGHACVQNPFGCLANTSTRPVDGISRG
jgi:hypothetical protein